MKSLKNYKYKVFDKECKLIGEIDKVMQAISHYDVMKQRNKIDKGISLITSYQKQINKLKEKHLQSDMYV
tara:strand:- start:2961 stop:3170 length:210 start_codon:yes stop_codon:yes gene_type:complete